MPDAEIKYFNALKKEIVATFRQSFPGASDLIEDWKGQTIVYFQEDVFEKVRANISEKWFYNHMKSKSTKLPRIDMLNILSNYCGYTDWHDFMFRNQEVSAPAAIKDSSNRVFLYVSVLTLLLVSLFYYLYRVSSYREYVFCFINADNLTAIVDQRIQFQILQPEESPIIYISDSTGCVRFRTSQIELRFVVSAPYYQTDTLVRTLKKYDRQEMVSLRNDDYALMLHYFANSKVEEWKKRREELNTLIADDAVFFEVSPKGVTGMEMYNKEEFINKITLPSRNIQHMKVLHIEYKDGQISRLRFSQ